MVPNDNHEPPPPHPNVQPVVPGPPRSEDAIPQVAETGRGYSPSTQVILIGVIVALFGASALYRYFILGNLMPWSLFFHGVSAILGIVLVALGPRGTLADRLFIGTTIALLMAGTAAGEGAICILIAAPFIYLFVAIAAYSGQGSRRTMVLAPVIFGASLASGLQPADIQQVSAVETVELSSATVAQRLSATPDIPVIDNGLLGGLPGASFPQPTTFGGEGLEVGDQRTIDFTDGGRLTLEITESEPGRVSFVPVSDTTAIANWVRWRQTTVSWDENSDGTTEVTLDVYYRRLLEPGWYFGPIVNAGMNQASEHLLHHLLNNPGAES